METKGLPLDRISAQRFLAFLTKNMQILLLSLLITSIIANVYLFKQFAKVNNACDDFKTKTIEYERSRGEKLEEILREEIKRDLLRKQQN